MTKLKVGIFQDTSIDSDDQGRQRRGLLNQHKILFIYFFFNIIFFIYFKFQNLFKKKRKKKKSQNVVVLAHLIARHN